MAGGLLGEGPSSGPIDVQGILDSELPKQVGRLMEMGVLVSLGTTRDRGAMSITVTQDGDWAREYFRNSMDAYEWLERAIQILSERERSRPEPRATTVPLASRRRSKLA